MCIVKRQEDGGAGCGAVFVGRETACLDNASFLRLRDGRDSSLVVRSWGAFGI